MHLPNLSNSMYVARLRFIQSIREEPEHRNPDTLVRYFFPLLQRWRTSWLGRSELRRLQADPFYYFLLARTKYYDQIVTEALQGGVKRIVGIGCGSDTRAHRFETLLRSNGVKVLECDQSDSINAKMDFVRKWRPLDYVEYQPIDLNDETWPSLERWLGSDSGAKTLVMLEGVSPYVNESNYTTFLKMLAGKLVGGSLLAYDFKLGGVNDEFGGEGRTRRPFRLTSNRDEVASFHKALGFQLTHFELSSELRARLLPKIKTPGEAAFHEDALAQFRVGV